MVPSPSSEARLLVSSQQTRFHIAKEDASNEIDVKGLSITIASSEPDPSAAAAKPKGKGKARATGLEILANAHLRLKAGVHYAFYGRNGTGKSTVLRALANKLIPGISPLIRIAILQQTVDTNGIDSVRPGDGDKNVLQMVTDGDPYRQMLLHELDVINKAMDQSDPAGIVQAVRKVGHERLRRDFLEAEKAAKFRSGARGLEARKALVSYEKKMEDSTNLLHQPPSEIPQEKVQEETDRAAALQADLQVDVENIKLADVEKSARDALRGLGFKDEQISQNYSKLSGGWKMRCLLARALVQTADILILDEPTNYLDLLGILWLQHYLVSLRDSFPGKTVLLVSHDRDFLNQVCSETVIIRNQDLTYFNGNLASYEKSLRHETLRLTRMKEAQDRQIAHMEKTIQKSKREGKVSGDDSKLRQAKSRQKKLDERMGMEVSAKGTRFKLNRDRAGFHNSSHADIKVPQEERGISLSFPSAPQLRFPGSLLSMDQISFSYPQQTKRIVESASLVVHPGDRVGVLGLNGSGKTTLIKLMMGQLKPSLGTLTRHPRLKIGYYSQLAIDELRNLPEADESLTPLALVMSRPLGDLGPILEQEARKLLGSLGLSGKVASETLVGNLSGGQLVRLALALIFLDPPHLLILDEPTTHLDLPTVSALGQALREYDGTLILVTHDRFFMRYVVEGRNKDSYDSNNEDSTEEEKPDDAETMHVGRRTVYEMKNAKLLTKDGGVDQWETGLEARLKKLNLL